MNITDKLKKMCGFLSEEKYTDNGDGYIYYATDNHKYISNYYQRVLMACGLRKNYGGKIVGWGNADDNAKAIVESVGGYIASFSEKKLILLIKALLVTIKYFLFYGKGERVLEFSYKGVKIGDVLCDVIIRNDDVKRRSYTVDNLRISSFYCIFVAAYYIVYSDWYFSKHRPIAFITHELGHQYAIFIRMSELYGARTFICSDNSIGVELDGDDSPKSYVCDVWNYCAHMVYESIGDIDYRKWVDDYLRELKTGKTDWNAANAYGKKKIITRDEWFEISGADKNKKNVVIMSHCFTDNAYTSSSRLVYKDYYVWLLEVIKLAATIDNVNWILKGHPSRYAYGEGEDVYELYKRYQTDNMYILSDEYNAESLHDIADVLLTVSGSCGIEFPISGIPVIATGTAFYSGFGSVIEVYDKDEYEELLKKLDSISRLTAEQIDIAYKVAYAFYKAQISDDTVFEIVKKHLWRPDIEKSNEDFVDDMIEYYESGHSYKDSLAYQRGLQA